MTTLLESAGLVDARLQWIGGRDRLVIVGDVLDRGPEERQILDLLMRLEKEAAAAGGSSDLLLGNHEVMNLVRDLRYVSEEGFAAFLDFERPEDRAAALDAALYAKPTGTKTAAAKAEFDRSHPPGWFGRAVAFGPEGDYARWLLTRPAMLVLDDTLFVHGGISESTAAATVEDVNRAVIEGVKEFWSLRSTLEQLGAVTPFATFADVAGSARGILQGPLSNPLRARAAARQLLAVLESPAFSSDGPLWYRGSSLENERIEESVLALALETYGVERIVVGHTPTRTRMVSARFGGSLLRIDTGMGRPGPPHALVFDEGGVTVLEPGAPGPLAVVFEPPQGEGWTSGERELEEKDIETILTDGRVIDVRPLGRGRSRALLVQLEDDDDRLRGIFKTLDTGPPSPSDRRPPAAVERWPSEIAAYRVDRMIGLRMVPATVPRKVQGTEGSMQRWVEAAIDLRLAQRDKIPLTEAQRHALARARIFDALIGNSFRAESDTLLLLDADRVMLVDHGRAFSFARDPGRLLGSECRLDPALEAALLRLNRKQLSREIGKLVGEVAVDALLARRDAILAACTVEETSLRQASGE